jgi:predicted DNA binding CopG/RHH family protein
MVTKKTALQATRPSSAEKLEQFVSGNPSTIATKSQAKSKPAESIAQTPQIETEKTKLKRLTLDISEELHRSIKMKSVSLGIPMVDMLRTLLDKNYGNS